MVDGRVETRGMLTLEQLRKRINTQEIDTVVVGFTDHYGRLMGKRYDAEMFVDNIVDHGAHGCDYLLTTDMEMEPVRGYHFANWELGYGDFHLVPDMSTLRLASWLPASALVLCDVHDTQTHEPVAVAPRSILRKQTESARHMGFGTFAASELEHYLFRTSYAAASQGALRDLAPAGTYREDYHLLQGARTEDFHGAVRRHLKESGVPVENSKGEFGRGQHEVNVRYAETLTMADRHVVFKQCMKELADSMGVSVTFMAKPSASEAGSGCHIHFSLWRKKRNAFVGSGNSARSSAPMSSAGSWADGSLTYRTSCRSTRLRSTRTSDTSTPPGHQRDWPGVATTAPRVSGSSATAKAFASNAASRARTAIRTLRLRHHWPRGSMASPTAPSRPSTSAETSMPHRICPACRIRSPKQPNASAAASSRSKRLAKTWSSTISTSSGRSSARTIWRLPTGKFNGTSSGSDS
jgi:hypothetical protein